MRIAAVDGEVPIDVAIFPEASFIQPLAVPTLFSKPGLNVTGSVLNDQISPVVVPQELS